MRRAVIHISIRCITEDKNVNVLGIALSRLLHLPLPLRRLVGSKRRRGGGGTLEAYTSCPALHGDCPGLRPLRFEPKKKSTAFHRIAGWYLCESGRKIELTFLKANIKGSKPFILVFVKCSSANRHHNLPS
jgi:hypothetical protein